MLEQRVHRHDEEAAHRADDGHQQERAGTLFTGTMRTTKIPMRIPTGTTLTESRSEMRRAATTGADRDARSATALEHARTGERSTSDARSRAT